MPTFKDVPCLFCNKPFTWQNDSDSNPDREPRICCWDCEQKAVGLLQTKTCSHCQKTFVEHHTGWRRTALGLCFECNFWIEYITRPNPNRVISEHTRRDGSIERVQHIMHPLVVGPDRGQFLGYGGAMWEAEFLDGTIRFSNNVWCQGDIPERFWQYFPVNVTYFNAPRKPTNLQLGQN